MMNYIKPADLKVLRSDEIQAMEKEYYEKFGEWFIHFSYIDFPGVHGVAGSAVQMYREALEKALLDDKPSTLKHEPDEIEIAEEEYYARQCEIEAAMERGTPIELTSMELLGVERRELKKQYEQCFGTKMKFRNFNKTVWLRHPYIDVFSRELLLESLRKGIPYPEELTAESVAWEQALLEKLRQEGKWPPQVSDSCQVWDREKILARLRDEIGNVS